MVSLGSCQFPNLPSKNAGVRFILWGSNLEELDVGTDFTYPSFNL